MSEVVAQLVEITGLPEDEAKRLLDIHNYNLEQALNFHLEAASVNDLPDEFPAVGGSSSSSSLNAEGSYPETINDTEEEEVRAPLPSRREQLVMPEDDNFRQRKRRAPAFTVCPLRNFAREAEIQEKQLKSYLYGDESAAVSTNVSSYRSMPDLSDDVQDPGDLIYTKRGAASSSKKRRLEDLFRPPLDILFCGSFHAARNRATSLNRWLIVNLQDSTQFQSQIINRDIWSNAELKNLIKEHFVLWQVFVDNAEGVRFKTFYKVAETPYICVIDPRTGEEKQSFVITTADDFKAGLDEYLQINSDGLEDPPKSIDEKQPATNGLGAFPKISETEVRNSRNEFAAELSEEEQLKLAIQKSLTENTRAETSGGVSDEDVIQPGTDEELVSYERFLGSADDPMSIIQLRLPDGERNQLEWPSTTTLMAIKLYVKWKYPELTKLSYKLISTCPRQNILEMDDNITLTAANLYPRAIVYLHPGE